MPILLGTTRKNGRGLETGYFDARTFVMNNCGVGTKALVDEDDGQKGGSFLSDIPLSLASAITISGNSEYFGTIGIILRTR